MRREQVERIGWPILVLATVIAANQISTRYGPEASIYNAFALIGFDLVARDRLHDLWGPRRFAYMALLIASGSALSYAVNHDAAQIAIASAAAFGAAALTDLIVYEALKLRPWLERVNGSNIPAAVVDSFVFISIAFGLAGNGPIVAGQIFAKIGGGAVWALLIAWAIAKRAEARA